MVRPDAPVKESETRKICGNRHLRDTLRVLREMLRDSRNNISPLLKAGGLPLTLEKVGNAVPPADK